MTRALRNRDILSFFIALSHLLSHGRVRLLLESSEIGLDVVNKSEDPGVKFINTLRPTFTPADLCSLLLAYSVERIAQKLGVMSS